MKFECSVEKIKYAVSIVERVTGKNLSLPVLSSVLFIVSENKTILRSTNLSLGIEITIPSKVETPGTFAVNGAVLNSIFLNHQKDEKVFFEKKDETILVSTNHIKTTLKTYDHNDFPTIPNVTGKTIEIGVSDFINGIKSVYYSASITDIKPEISSVYIYSEGDDIYFVSTDSFRLAEKKINIKGIDEISGILIPFKNIPDIVRILSDLEGKALITFNKNQISIKTKELYLTSRIIDGSFPDYKQIIPKDYSTEVILLKQDFLNILKTTNSFVTKQNQITLYIKPDEKKFEILSKNEDVGEIKSIIDASISGEEIKIVFNYKYLFDCFQSIPQDSISIRFSGSQKPVIITGVGDRTFTYLVMPMNNN